MKSTWRSGLAALGLLSVWGCGPPMLTQALPPGVEATPAEIPEDQRADALGEQAAMGVVQPAKITVQVIPNAEPTEPGQTARTRGGVIYETIKPGTGDPVTSGQTASINYALALEDGTEVEKSSTPYSFVVGGDGAIAGMQQGVAGMRVGEVRKLTIPPDLGYGRQGNEKIPPNATLVFQVELLKAE